jgi:hypothetical protein
VSRRLVAIVALLAAFASAFAFARSAVADDALDEPYPKKHHAAVRVAAGPAFRSLYDIDVGVGVLEIGAGADTKNGSFTGGLFGAFGETEEGLGMRHLGVLGQCAWTVGERIRLGFGPRVGWIALDKITDGDAAKSMTVGFAGEVGVDIVRASGFAVAVGVAPEIHAVGFGNFDIWSEQDLAALPSIGAFLQVRQRFGRGAGAMD